MVRFDRAAPGEGMIVYSRIENGKAYLEFQFFLKPDINMADYVAHIRVHDMSGRLALEIVYPFQEDDLAKGMLLHPHLWKGVSDPYLYSVKVQLLDKKNCNASLDMLERPLPLRTFEEVSQKGWFLNGESFSIRPVAYSCSLQFVNDRTKLQCVAERLQQLLQMGANTICLNRPEMDDDFIELCDRLGLLVWYCKTEGEAPEVSELLSTKCGTPTDLYYYYKACWSKEPFVYLSGKSLKHGENGNYSLTVYSNQKKVALYVEGVLFEFQMGAPEFLFEEIPVGKYPLQLTAEAGECRVSQTVYLSQRQ